MKSICEKFRPNKNGWHTFKGMKHDYRVATNSDGECIIECDTGEAMVVDYDKWFYRNCLIDDFWRDNF
uniref:Uncharacterized protein n=1 Tax=viral metagenome TaxID=1070528 RepID=A0A6H1ZAQ4_9ZZZZ